MPTRPAVLAPYGANHSNEKMVLKVLADILWAANSGDLTALALLDTSTMTKLVCGVPR